MKRYARPMFLIALVSALLLSFACSKKTQDSPRLEHVMLSFYSEKDGATSFYADDKKLEDRIGGSITTLGTVDGTEGFVVAASALYRINTEGLLKIYPAAVTNTVPALNGGKLLFATATMVFLYDDATRDYKKLEGIEATSIVDLALSPDGAAAGVTVLNGEKMMSYIYSGGEVREYGEGRCIVAVSNDAKTRYYMEEEGGKLNGRLHYDRDGSDKLISSEASPYFELNRDLSEITFDVNGKTHFSRNGGTAKKIVDSSVFSFAGAQRSSMGGKACITLLKNTDTLLNGIFYASTVGEDADGNRHDQYDIYYVNSSLSSSALALGADQFSVSEDGKRILTIVDNGLYSVTAYNPKSPELLAQGMYMFSCARDLTEIHCLDIYGNVYKLEDGRLSTILVTGIDLIKRIEGGAVLCYCSGESNGTLFALKGERAEPVAVGVDYFEIYDHAVVYLANFDSESKTYDLYISSDGENYRLAEQSVMLGK